MLVTKEELDQYMESDKFKIFHEHKQQKDDNHYILTVADPTQAMQGNKEQANEQQTQEAAEVVKPAAQSTEQPASQQATPQIDLQAQTEMVKPATQSTEQPASQQTTPQIDSQARTEVVKPAAQSTEKPDSQHTTSQIDSQTQTEVVKPAVQSTEKSASQQATPTSHEPQNTLLSPHKPLKPQDNQDGEYLNATLDGSGTLHINNDPQKTATVVTTKSRSAKVTSAKPKDTIENGASFTAPAAQDDMPIDYEKHMQEAEVASVLRENASHDFNKMERNAKSKNAMTKAKTIAQPTAQPLNPTESATSRASTIPAQPIQPSVADMPKPAPKAKSANEQPVSQAQPEIAPNGTPKASLMEASQQPQPESSQSSNNSAPKPEKLHEFSIDELENNAKIAKALIGASKESALIRAEISNLDLKPLKFTYLKNESKYSLDFKDENTIRSIRTMIIGGDGAITIGFSGGEAMGAYPVSNGVPANGITVEEMRERGIQWTYEQVNIEKMVTKLLPFCADISKVNLFGMAFAQLTFKTIILKKMP